ncbi:MAG: LytTR family DNA-binding domain-containing protein [Oscillospiraceae bacterium]|nr:LytTR family DNA-binding domain-containing protein [Oscillospiraceae bacterium]MCL2278513.1 LytTR family DNA-binding domain-containing protein [Oscillospiraceae bacterium]
MKVHLAICEDEITESEHLVSLVCEWARSAKISAEVSSYDSAEAFLFAYDADKSVDILLLDIQMKQIDGMALAKHLRQDGGEMQIVFITGLPDFVAAGYEVSALHYLMKPVCKEKLFTVLDKAAVLLNKTEETILVETENGQTKLFCRDIEYAEAFAHTTIIHAGRGEASALKAHISISELESKLGDAFLRCHRSYVVGLRHIRQITKTGVFMDSGAVVPLSRRRYNEINRAFIDYYT